MQSVAILSHVQILNGLSGTMKKKPEPHYETSSYNACAFCNQSGIRTLEKRGASYIAFVTKYQGTIAKHQGKFFITGWFPITEYKKIPETKYNRKGKTIYTWRIAYKSNNSIFLSIEDSLELSDERWKRWFGANLPRNTSRHPPKPQLNYLTKFLKKDSTALNEVKAHFLQKRNRVTEYVREIKKREV